MRKCRCYRQSTLRDRAHRLRGSLQQSLRWLALIYQVWQTRTHPDLEDLVPAGIYYLHFELSLNLRSYPVASISVYVPFS